MDPSTSVIYAVQELVDAVDDRLSPGLAEAGLSKAQFNVFYHVVEDGPLRLSDLARYRRCVRSNVTYLVRKMETEGLLSLTEDPHDRRVRIVHATQEGLARYRVARDAAAEIERKLRRTLGSDADRLAMLCLTGATALDAG